MQQHRHADTDRQTVDGGHQRLFRFQQRAQETADGREFVRFRSAAGEIRKIVAGSKGVACTGKDDDARFRIALRGNHIVGECRIHVLRQGILLFRTVERQREDAILS